MKQLDTLLLAPDSWRPVEPVSGRTSNRTSERELDRIPASVNAPSGALAVRLWDYSPFGLAVIQPHARESEANLPKGTRMELSLRLGDSIHTAPCQVENTIQHKGGLRIGLSRADIAAAPPSGSDGTLPLPPAAQIACEAANPLLYGEWWSLRLAGIDSGTVLVMASEDPTLIVFRGQELQVELALPTTRASTCRGRIAAAWKSGEAGLRFRLEDVSFGPGVAGELAEYLSLEGGIAPDSLKDLGFPIRFLRDRLQFRYAESPEDFSRAAALKAGLGLAETGKVPRAGRNAVDTRLLCAFHGATLAACASLDFPRGPDAILHAAGRIPGATLERLPEYTALVEAHGIAIHRDYRRSDLLIALIEHIARAFMLSDRSSLIRACPDRLLREHLELGFRRLGSEEQTGTGSSLVALDRSAVLEGRGLSLPLWLALFGDLVEDLLDKRLVRLGWARELVLRTKLRLRRRLRDRLRARAEATFRNFIFEFKEPE